MVGAHEWANQVHLSLCPRGFTKHAMDVTLPYLGTVGREPRLADL